MKLPEIENPQRMRGLYVFDFGQWTAVGYTTEEIAVLLDHEEYRAGKVYKIHRATPDGQFELRGVSHERFGLESGMFFHCKTLDAAQRDYEALLAAAEKTPPPCRAFWHLAAGGEQHTCALVFPAEYEDEMGAWLNEIDYQGGDLAEGGISHVTNYYEQEPEILRREQLWSQPATQSRSPQQVLESVRVAVQR